jgi:hypothetical protein
MTCRSIRRASGVACMAFLVATSALANPPAHDRALASAPVDATTAAIVAQRHLQRLPAADAFAIANTRSTPNSDGHSALYYCFDLVPQGYVIVSGATSLPPVMAYSFTSDAGCDLTPGNPLAGLLAWDLQQRLDYADRLPAAVAAHHRAAWVEYLSAAPTTPRGRLFQQWPPAGSTITGGWLTTNWTQSAPYNNLCPMDAVAHQRSLAGCPAVAIAQILNYHGRLNGTRFTDVDDYYHNYGGNQFWIDNNYAARSFPSWPQLNSYLQTLFGNYFYGTAPSDTSKAALAYACGAAAEQVYGASGSGTFAVAQAYQAFQRFGCTTAELLDESDPKLYARLADNMMAADPALLAVVDVSWSTGHNLVVDGYNTDDFYHLNFGWGGSYNGWYQLPSGMPYGLTVVEGVILDVMIDACGPMDCTCDGLVNGDDFTYLATCLSGPAAALSAPGCPAFDADVDSDVDLADFRAFQTAFGQTAR